MKKKATLILLFFALIIQLRTLAQPHVLIYHAAASDSVPCTIPSQVSFVLVGYATGYLPTDSVNVYVNFGDGTDTSYYKPATQFYSTFKHWYQVPGAFTQEYIATGPDGNADTLIKFEDVLISLTCGNISGTAFMDNNGNCVHDPGEDLLDGIPVKLVRNGVLHGYTATDTSGVYSFNAPVGFVYDVIIDTSGLYPYNLTCPAGGIYSGVTAPSSNLNAGFVCGVPGYDLSGFTTGWGFRPGFNAHLWVHAVNHGCQHVSGQVKLAIDPLLHYISAIPAPDVITIDTLTWNYSNLGPLQNFTASVNVLTDITAGIGDSVFANLIVMPVVGDATPADNSCNRKFPVRNSWDPNMKEVDPAGTAPGGSIAAGTRLTYVVHFQNTGTDTAYSIAIMDTLDPDLDASTFQLLSGSHATAPLILPGNIIRFVYNHIMLPDSGTDQAGSHGYVRYAVSTKNALANGTLVTNTAHIYFDFNPAITTNTVVNTIFESSGVSDYTQMGQTIVIPNPMHTTAVVSIATEEHSSVAITCMLYDLTGKKIKEFSSEDGRQFVIDRTGLADGLYYYRLSSSDAHCYGSGKIVIR